MQDTINLGAIIEGLADKPFPFKIAVACEGAEKLSLDGFTDFQEGLKTRSESDIVKILRSVRDLGFSFPFFYWRSGDTRYVLDGHGRLLALQIFRQLGGQVPPLPACRVDAEDIDDAKQKLLRLNSRYGTIDLEGLREFVDGLEVNVDDLELPDISIDDLEDIFSDGDKAETEADDEIPETVPEISKLGDLWELSGHRLLCGDSTDAEQIGRLMNGQKADMVCTSPPYNQKLNQFKPSGMQKDNPSWVNKMSQVYYDSLPEEEYQEKQINQLNMIYDFAKERASFLYNHKIRYRNKKIISPLYWLIITKWNIRQEIIWSRLGSVTQNTRMFLPSDERIYWLTKRDFYFNDKTDIKSFSTVWQITSGNDIKNVSAPFPTELPLRCVVACSKDNNIILEPYLGSGTTLIACEKTGRICYGMEIEPHYVDVTVRRWVDWCQKNERKPTLKLNGKRFAISRLS